MLTSYLAGLDNSAHLRRRVAFEDRRTGDEDLGACSDHERRGLDRDTAVHFDGDVGHRLEAPDLLDHLGDKGLASEAGVDAHYVHVAHVRQRPLYRLWRRRRVEGDAGLTTAGSDQVECAVQVRDDLGLDRNADDPGLDESWDQVVRVRYLEVGVDGKVDRGGERGRHSGPHGKVRDEVVVHHVEVYEFGSTPFGPPHFLRQFREIGREYRSGADHPITEPSEKRQEICLPNRVSREGHSTERAPGEFIGGPDFEATPFWLTRCLDWGEAGQALERSGQL